MKFKIGTSADLTGQKVDDLCRKVRECLASEVNDTEDFDGISVIASALAVCCGQFLGAIFETLGKSKEEDVMAASSMLTNILSGIGQGREHIQRCNAEEPKEKEKN